MKKDIVILYNKNNRTIKGFNSTTHTRIFLGIDVLLQKISKLFLTPLGSDIFNPSLGTTLPTFLARGGAGLELSSLESEVIRSAGQIEDLIKYEQATDFTLQDTERLKSIDLESVEIANGGSEVYITLLIKTMKNDTYFVRI